MVDHHPSQQDVRDAFLSLGIDTQPQITMLAESVLAMWTHQQRWVHRRVDSLSYVDDRVLRQQTSTDFSIPTWLDETATLPQSSSYLIPLGTLPKGRLKRFDVWREDGARIPILNRAQNGAIAMAVMQLAASNVARRENVDVSDRLTDGLRRVAFSAPPDADATLGRLLLDADGATASKILLDRELWDLVRRLARYHFALVRIDAQDGPRRVVKLAYDLALNTESDRRPSRLARFAEWAGMKSARLEIPGVPVGEAGAHHVELIAPDDLEIVHLNIVGRDREGGRYFDSDGMKLGVAHVRLSETERSTTARIVARLRVERRALPLPAAMTAAVIALLIVLGNEHLAELIGAEGAASGADQGTLEGAAALLFIVPTIASAYLVRPGEHRLARSLLPGTRGALAVSGICALAAGAVLVFGIDLDAARDWWNVLRAVAVACFGYLLLTAIFPRARKRFLRSPHTK